LLGVWQPRTQRVITMKNRAETFAGIGGVLGAAIAAVAATQKYNFSDTDQMQQAVGYVVGGLIVGALVGYFVGKSMKG
jgi:hypothetical protein